MTNEQVKSSKKITVGLILSWIFGILFALTGIISVFSEPIQGIIMLIMAAVLLPPVNKVVNEKWEFHLSGGMKIVVIIIGFVIFGSTVDTSEIEKKQNNQPEVQQEQEQPISNTEQQKDEVKPTEEQPKTDNNEKSVETDSNEYKEILIPSSRSGDKGKYYLMKYEKIGDNIKALNKRVGVDSVGYTITETNCKTMQIREFGYSEESPSEIIEKPSEWYDLVSGSSKSDLAKFLCENFYKNEEKTETTPILFDVPALLDKNISYFAPVFGQPVNEKPEPTGIAIQTGAETWTKRFEKDGYAIAVTYKINGGKVTEIFLSKGTYDMPLKETWISKAEVDDLLSRGNISKDASGYYYRFMWPIQDKNKYTGAEVRKEPFTGFEGDQLCNGYPEC